MRRSSLVYISDLILEVEDKLSRKKDFDFTNFIHERCRRYDICDAEEDVLRLVNKCLKVVNKYMA